ncbi:MAG: 5-oxoprolinase subunit PxpB [Phaeospirillum sp.]|nr:5-oxoprolinase subunit PxpB [Phaeospirillum sp.]
MLIRDVGDTAFSVEFDGNAEVMGLRAAIRRSLPLRGLVELVPSLRSLLVCFDPQATSRAEIEAVVAALAADIGGDAMGEGRLWRIPVRYDGPDLVDVAKARGLSVEEVVGLHSTAVYRVLMLGFMPGFAYMGGLSAALRLPRLATPRLRVPAGAVAIADDMTAIYPWESPGGWRLLGRSSVCLFDQSREPPALLAAGDRVEFFAE